MGIDNHACTCGEQVYSSLPSTMMTVGDPSDSSRHCTVEPLLTSCRLWMVTLTGFSVFLVAEVLRPGSLRKKSAVLGIAVAVRLMMSITQNSERLELALCSQVKVMSPPTGTT